MNNFTDGGFKKRSAGYDGRTKTAGHRGSGSKTAGSKSPASKSAGRPADLFKATCSTCNKDCMLPFRPNPAKAVYCSDCFTKKNTDAPRGKAPRTDAKSPRFDKPAAPNLEIKALQKQLKVIEDRLNRILDIINPPLPPKKATKQED